jgi:hypothetical protein
VFLTNFENLGVSFSVINVSKSPILDYPCTEMYIHAHFIAEYDT